jgi:hypothetical protein
VDKEKGFSDPRESLEAGTERLWDQEKPYEDYRMRPEMSGNEIRSVPSETTGLKTFWPSI